MLTESMIIILGVVLCAPTADLKAQSRPTTTQPQLQNGMDDSNTLEDARLTKELDGLTDEPLSDVDKIAYDLDLDRARHVDIARELNAKIDELLKNARVSHQDKMESTYESSKQSKKESLNELSKKTRALEDSHSDRCRPLLELRGYALGLSNAARGFAGACVNVKYHQDKKFIRQYRPAIRQIQNSFPSPAELDKTQRNLGSYALNADYQLAGLIKECLEQHDAALQQVAASNPCLCSKLLVSFDGTYWRINTVVKSWRSDLHLLYVKSAAYDAGSRNIHAKAIATAWAKAEMSCRVPDSLVEVACKWLDAYPPESTLISEQITPIARERNNFGHARPGNDNAPQQLTTDNL
jgi:hypothetical protein